MALHVANLILLLMVNSILSTIVYDDPLFEPRNLNNSQNCNFEVWKAKDGKSWVMNNLLLPKEICWEGAKKLCAWHKMRNGVIRNLCDRYVQVKQCFKTKRVLSFLMNYPPNVYNPDVDGVRPK
nr:uncharacterized protein LOC124811067 [Hydra vulgaris]